MITSITHETSSDTGKGETRGQETPPAEGVGEQVKPLGVCEAAVGKGIQERPPFKPKGTSITLTGMGRKDGSDVNNSMDLVTFYRLMLQKL